MAAQRFTEIIVPYFVLPSLLYIGFFLIFHFWNNTVISIFRHIAFPSLGIKIKYLLRSEEEWNILRLFAKESCQLTWPPTRWGYYFCSGFSILSVSIFVNSCSFNSYGQNQVTCCPQGMTCSTFALLLGKGTSSASPVLLADFHCRRERRLLIAFLPSTHSAVYLVLTARAV